MTTERVTLPIVGMTCAACQHHVEVALREVEGVTAAEVNLLANRATVTFAPRAGRLESLVEAVREAGYESAMPTGGEQDHAAAGGGEEHLTLRAGMALGAALLAMGVSMTRLGMAAGWVRWVELLVTAGVMAFASPETYRSAWRAARHGATNMNTLVALGTLAAFGYSAVATVAPGAMRRAGVAAEVYYEAVLFILGFLLVGSGLDARARRRTTEALREFQEMQPATALVVRDGAEREVPLGEVVSGDVVVVRPGDRVAVDGMVVAGRSTVDQALVTGESVPVAREVGDAVIGGTVNLDAVLRVRATTVGAAGMLAQMQRLLEDAQASKAPMQAMADRASAVFVPVVMALAAVTFLVWVGVGGGVARAVSAAVAVLVIACPCAMGLAVPAAVTVAVGRGAQRGILIKGGEVLERLAGVDALGLDKTGTLTVGAPRAMAVWVADGEDEAELVGLAAGLEGGANHPLARAVVRYAAERGVAAYAVGGVRLVPGMGVTGVAEGRVVGMGSAGLMREMGVRVGADAGVGTVLHLAVDGVHRMTMAAEDEVRATAAAAVGELERLGVEVSMVTGDRVETGVAVAERVGIARERVAAGMLPAGKVDWVKRMQAGGRRVAMAGDGMNDAAALAQADVGFAIGSGTDLARDAGDIVLLSPAGELSLMAIPEAVRLARRAVRTMRQNLWWATVYNVVGLPLAAGVFYPRFHVLLSPAVASAAMALSSTSVLVNSLRLRRFR